MSKGYVYILTNEAMPGLVKVGKTNRTPEARALELHQTGVPFPFEVFASFYSPDCGELERLAHEGLADCRVNQGREFFLCDSYKAEKLVRNAHREQIEVWLSDFLPDHGIADPGMTIDSSVPCILATYFDAHPWEVVDALHYVMPEDIAPAIKRMRMHVSGEKKMEWINPAPPKVQK